VIVPRLTFHRVSFDQRPIRITPAARINAAHLPISGFSQLRKPSGVCLASGTISAPSSAMRVTMAGAAQHAADRCRLGHRTGRQRATGTELVCGRPRRVRASMSSDISIRFRSGSRT
jgi:hypothetical protein